MRHGATDENGIAAVQDRMHLRPACHDSAPAGSRPSGPTYEYAGRDFRLTDVFGNVAHEIIA